MKKIWEAVRGAFDERDLLFVAGLGLVGYGLMQIDTTLAILGVGGVLLFVALRR